MALVKRRGQSYNKNKNYNKSVAAESRVKGPML